MRIATVNVNGVRAASRKGLTPWLEESQPEVLLLQEVRADEETTAALLPGYGTVTWPCRVKGRAGVAVAVREGSGIEVTGTRQGIALADTVEPDVDSGRWLEVELAVPNGTGAAGDTRALTVISAYLHSGQLRTPKMQEKLTHLALVDVRMTELLGRAVAGGPQVLMAGDLNVVRSEQDIKNWRPNHNRMAGVTDEEIAHLESWFASGWVDLARSLAPQDQGPYTWWSQRGKAFDNDSGWRIDYQVATPALAALATSAAVDRAATYDTRWSDHAPLVVDYAL